MKRKVKVQQQAGPIEHWRAVSATDASGATTELEVGDVMISLFRDCAIDKSSRYW